MLVFVLAVFANRVAEMTWVLFTGVPLSLGSDGDRPLAAAVA